MLEKTIPRRYLPSHAVLRSFECAARHQSFTLAAEELHLTQSAISRQVKELEAIIGTELFRRIGRRVVLTEAGRNLAQDLAVDLENIRQTVMRAISAGAQGSALRVAVLPSFASRWLVPRLPDFARKHPDIEINLSTRLQPFDVDKEHFDLAIHFGSDDWPNTDMQVLCTETLVAVASPHLCKAHSLTSPEFLASAPLLHMEARPLAWQKFFSSTGLSEKAPNSGKYFDQFSMVIAGAIAGLGAALIPTYLIERELAEGSLVLLDKTTVKTDNNYYLVTPHNSANQQVELFVDWMKNSVNSVPD